MAQRLIQFVMTNKASVQKGDIPDIEHLTTIWEAIQRAKKNRLSLYAVWLDLANA